MGNFGKEALTPDIQLTFTCFLKKRFFGGQLLHQGPEVVEDKDSPKRERNEMGGEATHM